MTPDPAAVLSVTGLCIRFGGLTAIDAMTFDVREGEVLSLIGPNGAGKTSAFNAITGYLRPASGDIRYRGRSLAGGGLRPSTRSRNSASCAPSRRPACSAARACSTTC